jgi:hypothetical protein
MMKRFMKLNGIFHHHADYSLASQNPRGMCNAPITAARREKRNAGQ